jgi:hypothetical protein
MRRTFVLAGRVLMLLVFSSLPGLAQTGDDLSTLRKEVEALKEGQKAIQSELQDIKNFLRARPMGVAPPAQEAVVSIEGAPFKGDKTAKLTLVEFTDYQ